MIPDDDPGIHRYIGSAGITTDRIIGRVTRKKDSPIRTAQLAKPNRIKHRDY